MNNKIFLIIFIPLSVILFLVAVLSLKWRMVHDPPIMLYLAYLMDRFHYVPYRDFFDFNMPGTYLIHLISGKIFGYGDFGFRCFDLLYLGGILAVIWFWLKKISWKVAWCSSVLFGLVYLGYGPYMSMQREFLIILPVSAAIVVSYSFPKFSDVLKFSMVGFLFGLSAIIKPQGALGFPLVLLYRAWDVKGHENGKHVSSAQFFQILLFSLVGFALPISAMLAYLWQAGALPYFFDMIKNYLPLYSSLSGAHQTLFGFDRTLYLINGFLGLGFYDLWLMPGAIGVFIALFHSSLTHAQRRQVGLLIGLVVLYSIYPVFAGKFWTYHYLIFCYFVVLLSSLCFVEQRKRSNKFEVFFPVIIIVLVIFLRVITPLKLMYQIQVPGEVPKVERVDEIAGYLKSHMKPGDKVQPLDWTGGAVHAMLITKAQIATPFVYDFHFYHHISSQYIQNLRRRFLERLNASRPRFIIQIWTDKPWVSGFDTTKEFGELQSLLNVNYSVVFNGKGYVIYERIR